MIHGGADEWGQSRVEFGNDEPLPPDADMAEAECASRAKSRQDIRGLLAAKLVSRPPKETLHGIGKSKRRTKGEDGMRRGRSGRGGDDADE